MMTSGSWLDVMDATWPPERFHAVGPCKMRFSNGGGRRVCAITVSGAALDEDILAAEREMSARRKPPVFLVFNDQPDLDQLLEKRGYQIGERVTLYTCETENLTRTPVSPLTVFPVPQPLAVMREIWAAGGVGADRLAVMARASNSMSFLGRIEDRPAGAAFAACAGDVAFVYALEIKKKFQKQGLGGWMMRRAAFWAKAQKAQTLAVHANAQNIAANKLYQGLGFAPTCTYHYRVRNADKGAL